MELLEKILEDTNLDEACKQEKRARGSNGVDKMSTMELASGLKKIAKNLRIQYELEGINQILY